MSIRTNNSFVSVAALLAIILTSVVLYWQRQSIAADVVVASVENQSKVALSNVSCISIDPSKIIVDRVIYDISKVMPLVDDILPSQQKKVGPISTECPWGLFVTVLKSGNFVIEYKNKVANYLISIGVCSLDGKENRISANECVSKSVYVFGSNVPTLELIKLALIGLRRDQIDKWEVFKQKVGQ